MQYIVLIRRIRLALSFVAIAFVLLLCSGVFEMATTLGGFVNGTGGQLRIQCKDIWPDDVTLSSIRSTNYVSSYSIDSHSKYISFESSPSDFEKWKRSLQEKNIERDKGANRKDKFSETRESTIERIDPIRFIDRVPSWWGPAEGTWDAYETMLWYKDHDSGVGYGSYIQFDSATNRVWIYCFSCQHQILWPRNRAGPTVR
jgi:hypothetical protein